MPREETIYANILYNIANLIYLGFAKLIKALNIQNGDAHKAVLLFSNLDNLFIFHLVLIIFPSICTVFQDLLSQTDLNKIAFSVQ